MRNAHRSDTRVVNKREIERRELQGRGGIVDGVGAEGENRAVKEVKDGHRSSICRSKGEENTETRSLIRLHLRLLVLSFAHSK